MSRLNTCLDWILRAEGGLSLDPDDRGGLTNYGISQAAYPDVDIAALTEADARAIYQRDYWMPCRCAELPPPLDLVVLDGAVLMGVGASVVQLQRALRVDIDGVLGPKTLAAAKANGLASLERLFTERLLYLAKAVTWKQHGRGWTLRTFALAREAFR
jgi:lysozyme family protein